MKIEKVENWICYTHKKFKRSVKSWISFEKKVNRVITFYQNAWKKCYFDINTDLRKKPKNFFKLINNAVFGKNKENVRKH